MKDVAELLKDMPNDVPAEASSAEVIADNDEQRRVAFNTAARYLGFRPRSVKEARDKLASCEFSPEVIDSVIDELIAAKYLDDKNYALLYIQSVSEKYGKRRVCDTLRRRGVAQADIDVALLVTDSAMSDIDAAKALIIKRYGEIPVDFKERQRAKGFLVRRGFSFSEAEKALAVGEES